MEKLDSTRVEIGFKVKKKHREKLLKMSNLQWIQYSRGELSEKSLKRLNKVFRKKPHVYFRFGSYQVGLLDSLPDLQMVQYDSNEIVSLDKLYNLKNLKALHLGASQVKPKLDLSFLVDFKDTLEDLYLVGDFKNLETTIPQLTNLKSLGFYSTKLENFEFLKGLKLEKFMNGGGRVKDLSHLGEITTLKCLELKSNKTIENIDFISTLENIEYIHVNWAPRLTSCPKCDHLTKLGTFFLSDVNRLEDFTEIDKWNKTREGKPSNDRDFWDLRRNVGYNE